MFDLKLSINVPPMHEVEFDESELLDAAIEYCEAYESLMNLINTYDAECDAHTNVCDVQQLIDTIGITPALESLLHDTFKTHLSTEEVQTIKSNIAKQIRETTIRIWTAIKVFFDKFWLVGDRLTRRIDQILDQLDKPNIQTSINSFKGLELSSLVNSSKSITKTLKLLIGQSNASKVMTPQLSSTLDEIDKLVLSNVTLKTTADIKSYAQTLQSLFKLSKSLQDEIKRICDDMIELATQNNTDDKTAKQVSPQKQAKLANKYIKKCLHSVVTSATNFAANLTIKYNTKD